MRQSQNHQPQHWPLSRQIIATSIAAVLIVGVAIGELVRKTEKETLFTDLQNRNMQTVALLSAASLDAVISEDRPLIESIIEQMVARAPEIVSVVYKNETGKVLASWKDEEPIEEKFVKTFSEGIELAGEAFGTLTIEWNIEPGIQTVQGRVDRIRLYVAASLLIVTIVFLVLAHWLALAPISVIHKRLSERSQSPPPSGLVLPAHSSKELVDLWNSADLLAKTSETLRKSEALFRTVVNHSPTKIHIKDVDGRYTLINKEAEKLFGVTDEEGRGKTTHDLFGKDVADSFVTHDQAVIESGKAMDMEEEFTFENDVRTYLTTKFPIFDQDEITGVGAIGTDITERKRAEEAVKASEARLAEILDIAPEAVITIDSDMNIQLFNQGAERIFGYGADEVVGRPVEILIPESLRDGHQKHVQGFDGSGDTYRLMDQRQEIMGLQKDGTEFPATASVSKLEVGGEKMYTVMLRDITERKNAQDALLAAKREAETANRAKSEFLASMSHELRTPLNAILGFADILSHQYFGPTSDKYKEYAEDIHSSSEHLLTLVNEILDLSTIESGKQSLVKEKLSTEEIIRECVRIVKDKARSSGIDLVTKVPKDLSPLYADRRAFKQILLNLLSNAVKFTPEGGKITVSAKASKRNTTLKIADTGKGIPAETLPKLTDPFTFINNDPYRTEPGWGLGLAISKSLIDLHDGTLDIKSKVGKGTTVTLTFPNGAP